MMENIAATPLRKKLRRHASGSIRTVRTNSISGNGGPRESTSLLAPPRGHDGDDDDDRHPLWKDDRAWVRWPMKTLHVSFKTLLSNYVNFLLVFVPLGIVAGASGWDPTAVFVLNFLAIIPLASLLSFATEELSVKLGQTLGGLLNASFGNAVELIVSRLFGNGATSLMMVIGEHRGPEERGNQNCAVQHAGFYSIQYSLGPWLLLPCGRYQTS